MKRILRKIPGYDFGKKAYFSLTIVKNRIRNLLNPTARILLYHRIADIQNDPHLLAVSPENFNNQLKFLKENFKIISLAQLIQDIKTKRIQNDSVAITFDDGYADNLYNALPILEKHGIPATIFITTGKIGDDAPFYWEGDYPEKDRGRCLNQEELNRLSSSKFIEIGAHTVSHPRLSRISIEEQAKEIAESRQTLNRLLNMPINSFAYPFGGKGTFNEATMTLVRKNGFNYACANIHKRVTKKTQLYTLPRFVVRNWDVKNLEQEMNKWL